jgi:hypothetical protein
VSVVHVAYCSLVKREESRGTIGGLGREGEDVKREEGIGKEEGEKEEFILCIFVPF